MASTRLMVKSLPLHSTEESVRQLFGEYGTVTDCRLLHRKRGKFRGFAFVGFSSEESSKAAIEALNGKYVLTQKISVEPALTHIEVAKGEEAKEARHPKKQDPSEESAYAVKLAEIHSRKNFAIPEELDKDETFQRFVKLHMSGKDASWKNSDVTEKALPGSDEYERQLAVERAKLAYIFDGESDSDEERPPKGGMNGGEKPNLAPKDNLASQSISDMEYLKAKAGKNSHLDSDDETSPETKTEAGATDPADEGQPKTRTGEGEPNVKDGKGGKKKGKKAKSVKEPVVVDPKQKKRKANYYKVKMWPLPLEIEEEDVRSLFEGKVNAVKFPKHANSRKYSIGLFGFDREAEMDAAMAFAGKRLFGFKKVMVCRTRVKTPKVTLEEKSWKTKSFNEVEPMVESGRLFIINLPYTCTEEDLEKLFSKYGELVQVLIPLDALTGRMKGFAHITYVLPENAVTAFNELNCTTFQGRVLHLLPGRPLKSEMENESTTDPNNFKKLKAEKEKKEATSSHNWNTLFLGGNAVADAMAQRYKVKKADLLAADQDVSLGVRMALGETEIVNETREFLLNAGISLDTLAQAPTARSKTVILVKNLPFGVEVSRLEKLFAPHGTLGRVVMPPSGITAVIEFQEPNNAKTAFLKLAYKRFDHVPLYLEWAPVGIFTDQKEEPKEVKSEEKSEDQSNKSKQETTVDGITLFVKNLNFDTNESQLIEHFKSCGDVISAVIARKTNPKDPKKPLSMGYGFVKFATQEQATEAVKLLQLSTLDGHKLDINLSQRKIGTEKKARKNTVTGKEQKGCKILVRNIPFQAKQKEIKELFEVFGELSDVRLPKNVKGTHKGFAFVEYSTREDAKRAFETVCHSTHLYGRRLVLEWADSLQETIESLREKTANTLSDETTSSKRTKLDIRETMKQMAKKT